jgi:hypothetical protein
MAQKIVILLMTPTPIFITKITNIVGVVKLHSEEIMPISKAIISMIGHKPGPLVPAYGFRFVSYALPQITI